MKFTKQNKQNKNITKKQATFDKYKEQHNKLNSSKKGIKNTKKF